MTRPSPGRGCQMSRTGSGRGAEVVIDKWCAPPGTGGSGMIDVVRDKPAIPGRDGDRHSVAVVVYDGISLFEFSVALEVFATDWSELSGVPWYRTVVCAAAPGAVTADGGLQIQVVHGLEAVADADTVIVPPTERLEEVPAAVLEALAGAHHRGQRIVS